MIIRAKAEDLLQTADKLVEKAKTKQIQVNALIDESRSLLDEIHNLHSQAQALVLMARKGGAEA